MVRIDPPSHLSPTDLTDPPSLVAVARAARLSGDRSLERAAKRLLREQWGIALAFRPGSRREEVASAH
jgi:hypothetical protein